MDATASAAGTVSRTLGPGQHAPMGLGAGRLATPRSQWPTPGELRQGFRELGMDERQIDRAVQNAIAHQKASRQAAVDFEAYFVSTLLKDMKKSVERNDMFSGGRGEEIFDAMLSDEQAKTIAAQSNFGIADMLEQSFIRQAGGAIVQNNDAMRGVHRSADGRAVPAFAPEDGDDPAAPEAGLRTLFDNAWQGGDDEDFRAGWSVIPRSERDGASAELLSGPGLRATEAARMARAAKSDAEAEAGMKPVPGSEGTEVEAVRRVMAAKEGDRAYAAARPRRW